MISPIFSHSKLCIFLIAASLSAAAAQSPLPATPPTHFRNTDPNIPYAGSKSCLESGCHQELGERFKNRPMGHTIAPANVPSDLARVPKPVTFFNEKNNRYYQVYSDGKDLYQSAWELDKKGRKTYFVTHKMDFVVGGGLTGYSYLYRIGQWLFQAPLSYYQHSGTWELSPGFPIDDLGFTRHITTGCMLCHNGQPDPEPKRDGRFKDDLFRFSELTVSCETCHGPGSLHNKEAHANPNRKLAPTEIDTSIVNPAKLEPHIASDLCRQCHQLGDAAYLFPGKSFLDYRPGTPLGDTMAFLTRPLHPEQRAEADRLEKEPPVRNSLETPMWWKGASLELSKCYQSTHGALTCMSCHTLHEMNQPNPELRRLTYRDKCLACHKPESCKLPTDATERAAVHDNCIECHMEKRPVAGIAHSNDTKHRIVRTVGQSLPDVAFTQPTPDIPGLIWMNRPEPSASPNAAVPQITQLEAYWTVIHKDNSLDSYFYKKLAELAASDPNNPVVLNIEGAVAIGRDKKPDHAIKDFEKALKLGQDDPSTLLNLANAYESEGRHSDAEAVLERGISNYPYSGPLLARLIQVYTADGQVVRARLISGPYRKLFPDDLMVREALRQAEDIQNGGNLQASPNRDTVVTPR